MVKNRCNVGALFLEMFQVWLRETMPSLQGCALGKTVPIEVNTEFPFSTALIVS